MLMRATFSNLATTSLASPLTKLTMTTILTRIQRALQKKPRVNIAAVARGQAVIVIADLVAFIEEGPTGPITFIPSCRNCGAHESTDQLGVYHSKREPTASVSLSKLLEMIRTSIGM